MKLAIASRKTQLLKRSGALHAVEFKLARATAPYLACGLRAIMADTGAASATVIDQGGGSDLLAPGVARRGFAASAQWPPNCYHFSSIQSNSHAG